MEIAAAMPVMLRALESRFATEKVAASALMKTFSVAAV